MDEKIEKETTEKKSFPWVGIGASAGGLDAFSRFISNIPTDSGMAYVLVQHLAPNHQSLLPSILQKKASIPVLEISDDLKVDPDHIYIIPPNKLLLAYDGKLKLEPRPEKKDGSVQPRNRSLNMPIDLFFSSLAEVHQAHAVGVVLSGTASDGTLGLKAIKEMGGITLVQDEESAEYNGMPRSAATSGYADFITSPEAMPGKIMQLTSIIDEGYKPLPSQEALNDIFRQILYLLRVRKSQDFTYYKQSTIRRRIYRRMALTGRESPEDYLKFLRDTTKEQDILYQDLLIPVTSFFRDSSVFENLCETMFPDLMKNKQAGNSVRVWVAGCSTGEEAYTIAICLKDYMVSQNLHNKVQIFCTDISEPAIAKARSGIFKPLEILNVPPKYLKEYFTKTGNDYQVCKSIRDLCIFAVHSFIKDPPFSKLDFISCRNVLIYMEPFLQKKAMMTFHYGLLPHGYLLLGKSETANSVPGLFSLLSSATHGNDRIYTKNDVVSKYIYGTSPISEYESPEKKLAFTAPKNDQEFHKSVDELLLSKFSPPGVVINEAMDIVQFRGITAPYLQQASGKPSHNLLKLAKDSLAFELRNIIHKVKTEHSTVHSEGIPLEINGENQVISLEGMMLEDSMQPHYLILFHQHESSQEKVPKTTVRTEVSSQDVKDLRINQLEKELAHAREDMRRITEDQETVNEELQSSNEELLSSSEELQSLNEELETGKEELQSTNEELLVVNQEVMNLNEEINKALEYAESIIATIHEPLLVLDKDLRIRQANRSFFDLFALNATETEGKYIFELGNGDWSFPELRSMLEKILPEKSSFKNYRLESSFSKIGYRIMELNASEIKNEKSDERLMLLALEDITERMYLRDKEKEMSEIFQNMVIHTPVAMMVLRHPGHVVDIINKPALEIFKLSREKMVNSPFFKVLPDLEDQGFHEIFDEIYLSGKRHISVEREVKLRDKGDLQTNYFDISCDAFRDTIGNITGIVTIWNDVTTKVIARKKIEESEKKIHFMTDFLPQKLWTADQDGNINYFNQRWMDFCGKTFEELKDWGWKSVIHPDDWAENQRLWQHSIKSGKTFQFQHRFKSKNGEYIWHLSRGFPFKDNDGNVQMWVGSSTEIQDVKEEEERRGDFIKMVSHELKTPVTSIKGYIQLLLMMTDNEQQLKYPNNITESLGRVDKLVERLTRLITEMLDLSRIEGEQMELQIEKFPLGEVVEQAVIDFRLANPKHTILYQQDDSCEVDADKHKIEQVVINLLSNAVKYSEDGDVVKVKVFSREKNTVSVSVQDEGIGIDPRDHNKIFDRFYRVSGRDEQTYPGFGIGLFISKDHITRHNGTLSLESEKHKGSTFTFTLPCH